jgi:small subunit ribosomal protein S5
MIGVTVARFQQVDTDALKIEKTVQLKPVSKTVKGGRKRRFSSLVVVGDGNGHVGVGMGKSASVPDSITKGSQRARKNLIEVPLINTTIPHTIIGRMGAARIMLKPAAPGTALSLARRRVPCWKQRASRTSSPSRWVRPMRSTLFMRLWKV